MLMHFYQKIDRDTQSECRTFVCFPMSAVAFDFPNLLLNCCSALLANDAQGHNNVLVPPKLVESLKADEDANITEREVHKAIDPQALAAQRTCPWLVELFYGMNPSSW
jgi:hypothetical protein